MKNAIPDGSDHGVDFIKNAVAGFCDGFFSWSAVSGTALAAGVDLIDLHNLKRQCGMTVAAFRKQSLADATGWDEINTLRVKGKGHAGTGG